MPAADASSAGIVSPNGAHGSLEVDRRQDPSRVGLPLLAESVEHCEPAAARTPGWYGLPRPAEEAVAVVDFDRQAVIVTPQQHHDRVVWT